MYNFIGNQDKYSIEAYVNLLKVTGALSNLYSDSQSSFLYYRVMENVFCKAFNADNLSRSDVSADAAKNGIGIGLKTFLQGNGMTFQKVAEFNRESHLFRENMSNNLSKSNIENIIVKVSEMRNERIDFTERSYALNEMVYHSITRSKNLMSIYEEPMERIDINSLEILPHNKNVLKFKDKYNEYSFSLSKSTLLKRFLTTNSSIKPIPIEIYEDPFEFLMYGYNNFKKLIIGVENEANGDYIVLPLYSPRSNKVEKKSGLNQWNADGRKRNDDEVYIPIPSWIHKSFPHFFNYDKTDSRGGKLTTDTFNVRLPNKRILKMKVAQENGKALMSDPNSALGEWILRDVLNIPHRKLVTKEMLELKGIDSVKLTKMKENQYYLDFLKTGSFENFKEKTFENTEEDLH